MLTTRHHRPTSRAPGEELRGLRRLVRCADRELDRRVQLHDVVLILLCHNIKLTLILSAARTQAHSIDQAIAEPMTQRGY
jgi:hypothetical protein